MNIVRIFGFFIIFLLFRCCFDNVVSFGLTCSIMFCLIIITGEVQRHIQEAKALKKREEIKFIRNKKM